VGAPAKDAEEGHRSLLGAVFSGRAGRSVQIPAQIPSGRAETAARPHREGSRCLGMKTLPAAEESAAWRGAGLVRRSR